MPFSKKFIDDIRAAADIVQIVGEIIELKEFPGDRYKGLCPFHNESSPSFVISNDLYHCFGCGEGGDVIRFIERTQGMTFGAAVRKLAERYDVPLEDSGKRWVGRPRLRPIPPMTQPLGYAAPSGPFVATYDPHAAELFASQPTDLFELLTLGVVPIDLILELENDLSHL